MLLLLPACLFAQEPWLEIPTDVPLRESGVWLVAPFESEAFSDDPVPQWLDRVRPVIDGRLLLTRAGVLECWDVEARRRVWKLAPATPVFGWGMAGRRVARVFPGGPADRAGVVAGDLVTGVDGIDVLPWSGGVAASGERRSLRLESAGGERTVDIEAQAVPEPYGRQPKLPAYLDGDPLVARDGRVERVAMRDGRVVWSVAGGWMARSGGRVLVQPSVNEFAAVDANDGSILWTIPTPLPFASEAFADEGAFLVRGSEGVARLDAATGRVTWNYRLETRNYRLEWVSKVTLQRFGEGRLLVAASDLDCEPAFFCVDGFPLHDGPTCITYHVFDAKSGESLWWRKTGGRLHGGAHRWQAPEYIPFDPHLGGPATVRADRLLWFDVENEELSVFDSDSLEEVRRVSVPGAIAFSDFAPDGFVAVRTEDEVLWIDPDSGAVRATGLSEDEVNGFVFDGERLVVLGNGSLKGFDLRPAVPAAVWKREFPLTGWPWLQLVEGGRFILLSDLGGDSEFAIYDARSGERLESHRFATPAFRGRGGGTTYRSVAATDRYLLMGTSDGIRVFRSPHVDRDD